MIMAIVQINYILVSMLQIVLPNVGLSVWQPNLLKGDRQRAGNGRTSEQGPGPPVVTTKNEQLSYPVAKDEWIRQW